ncbi:type I secretion system permease/ATPase [Halomonas sp. MCCC 1A11036]|uniref:Type I secretion system permease/ATPase n=1 Tax=Billgrantia zhangzhouensis TaxID=2733481 RepID=A0ABS9AAX7_9GAMM|nr:type I secretion system permease/ATPase [Halomonas zhangzhouensis]MCE8018717.1 type I secretion system permease/ATPase [Halomonas zhangzhouensis]
MATSQAQAQAGPCADDPARAAGHGDDPLRSGLALLCHRLGRDTSEAELGDGLALVRGRLPLELAPRALRRVEIEGRVLQAPLERLAGLLPALLIMADGATRLLVALDDDEGEVLLPETGGGAETLGLEALAATYGGMAVVARPAWRGDGRAGDFAQARGEHWLKGPLKRCWKNYAEVGVAALVANMLAVSTAIFAMQVYDRVVPTAALDTLWILASGVALAVVLEFVLRTLRAHLLDITGKGLDLHLSARLFEQVMQLRLAAKPGSTGAFSSQLREFESVREFLTASTIGAISDLPFVLLFLGVIAWIGGPVAWVPLVAVILMVLPGLLAQGRLARLSRETLREGAVRHGVLLESIEHLETLKATRAEGRSLRLYEQLSQEIADTGSKSRSLSALLGHGATAVQQLCYVGVVIVGVYLISAGELTVGALIACTILASRSVAPMTQVAGLLARWQHVKVALEGLDELMKAPVERPAGRTFTRKPMLRGDYRLEEVRLSYLQGQLQSGQEGPPALNLKALEIQAGERIALLGGIGAGKSSLLRLLAGLNEPSQGQLLLDDVSLAQIEPADRRRAIGYLPQDGALFYGSLRANLLLDGAAHDDAALFEALDAVGLAPFVRRHPLGLDLPIQGSGSVSGGQRQAIGLARLLLQDPHIVLLDEPTAAFDQTSERRVLSYLRGWMAGRTLVLATHKKALLALTERALVLRDGRLVMDGPVDKVVNGNLVRASGTAAKIAAKAVSPSLRRAAAATGEPSRGGPTHE